jgi:TRAP-type C4-dicarboxylate transport system permease small subunit
MKGLTIGAGIGLLFAVLIAGAPFLLALGADSESDTAGGAVFALTFITIPMGAIVGLMAVTMLFVLSVIGVFRLRGESTVRRIIAIAAPILMMLPVGVFIWGSINAFATEFDNVHSATPTTWALMGAISLVGVVGVVLAIISGLTAPPRKAAVEGSPS